MNVKTDTQVGATTTAGSGIGTGSAEVVIDAETQEGTMIVDVIRVAIVTCSMTGDDRVTTATTDAAVRIRIGEETATMSVSLNASSARRALHLPSRSRSRHPI